MNRYKLRERVLLLQGPVGPFFKHLQDSLTYSGYEVWRICFHAGDRFFSRKEGRINFHGDSGDWKNWLSDFIATADIDGIILFGSEREIHRIAREIAVQNKIKIISLEEGYIRPGFITIEQSGNNASSPIAHRLPSANSEVHLDDGKPVENFREGKAKVWHNIVYYSLRNLFTYGKQRKLYHKQFSLLTEIFCWGRSVYRRVSGQTTNFMIIQHLLEYHDRGYFLVPLQVDSDCQLREFSMGWSQVDLISKTLRSFAKKAPRGKRLVFKIHPLARGHSNYKHLIQETARAYGVSDRVDVLDTGSLGLLTRHSAGMITINSTSGFSAIYHGIPLLVVGNALYAHPELATCGNGNPDFDSFWAGGAVANFETRRGYLGWVKRRALAVGDFYAARGIRLACQHVCSKLQEENSAEHIEFKVRNAG
jgi:capsular polysaccharide export protein